MDSRRAVSYRSWSDRFSVRTWRSPAPILSGERHKGSNLPVQPTSFIGRERELAQLVSLLARDEVRLLTVTGPGGCGKTRLALEAAREVSDEYQDGVCWVPLAALRDPALVMDHVSQALGSQEQPRVQIADRQLLLLLDNFEHLTGAAPRVAELIAACPKLKLLVTSREPLHVAGEREYLMPMLANEEAVELFRQRAHSAGPEETVLAICRKLDLLPLAIELAAARTKLLSPDTLLARLDQSLPVLTGGPGDAPQRQRTLRATIAWSYELLTPGEQVLFTRLAVFAGACTLEAAEEVCQADLDTLQALIDKNLLRRQNDRYEMLETIREYASEVLEASTDRDGVRDRHAAFYGARARVFAHTSSDRFGQFVAYDRLPDVERDFLNYRAALGWMKTRGVVRAEAQLAADLVSPLFFLGFWSEGRTLLADVLTRVGDDQPVSVRLELLGGVAAMAVRQGAGEEAWEYARRHLELARRSGNAHELLHPLNSTGTTAARVGKLETASLLFREAEAKARELGNHFELGRALLNLAWISEARGATEAAAGLLEEAISEARAAGGGSLLAGCWTTLASQLVLAGRTDDAAAALAEAFDTLRTIGTKEHLTVALETAACIAANRGLTKRGAQLLAAAERIRSETGAQDTAFADVLRERLQEELNDSTFQHEWAKGRRMGAREAAEEGLTLLESNSCAIRTRVAQGTFPNTGPRGI